MFAGFRPPHLEYVVLRRQQHGGGGHEATDRVTEDANLIEIDERVARAELFDGVLLTGQRLVAPVAVAVAIQGERPQRAPATRAPLDHNEAKSVALQERQVQAKARDGALRLRGGRDIVGTWLL